ncbi:MAG: hypothetical protein RLZ35_1145 [Pseudomonadota bacterium]|jgi:putative transposase
MKINVNKNKLSLKSRKASQYRSHWHCVYHLKYHLVLVTKYRKKCLSKSIQTRLYEILVHICTLWDVKLIEFCAESDHIHLLLDFHPSLEPAKFIGNLKTVSSRFLRKEFPVHLAQYYWKPLLWSRAYCLISAGGAPLDILKRYIQEQGTGEE